MSDIHLASYKIREATISDVSALAILHVDTFKETHGAFPDSPTCSLRQYQWQKIFEDKSDSWFVLVIEKPGEGLIGFAKGQTYEHTDQPSFSGELNKIYLLRRYQKLGLGRQLICAVAKEFLHRGIHSMLLFGDARNPSNQFYEHLGAVKLRGARGEFHGGYGWTDLHILLNAHCDPNGSLFKD